MDIAASSTGALVAVLMWSSIGVATPITADALYELGNHPDGGAANPLYGLRLDGLLTADSSDIYTFDFAASGASMSMLWSSGTDELRIWGTAFGGQDIGSDYLAGTTALWPSILPTQVLAPVAQVSAQVRVAAQSVPTCLAVLTLFPLARIPTVTRFRLMMATVALPAPVAGAG